MDWEVYPDGLAEILLWVRERYGKFPLYVTENGAALADAEPVGDLVEDPAPRRPTSAITCSRVRRAIDGGVDVRGYFAWSLLDNFEWSQGFSKRFGLIRVDYATQKRTAKASARYYTRVIRSNGAALEELGDGASRRPVQASPYGTVTDESCVGATLGPPGRLRSAARRPSPAETEPTRSRTSRARGAVRPAASDRDDVPLDPHPVHLDVVRHAALDVDLPASRRARGAPSARGPSPEAGTGRCAGRPSRAARRAPTRPRRGGATRPSRCTRSRRRGRGAANRDRPRCRAGRRARRSSGPAP